MITKEPQSLSSVVDASATFVDISCQEHITTTPVHIATTTDGYNAFRALNLETPHASNLVRGHLKTLRLAAPYDARYRR